jgi:Asp-tRNA(Asn)/Glu-tRNA(Gln) amidotransferase A subunit family amidase
MKELSLEQIIADIKSGKTTKEKVFGYFQKRIEKYDDIIKSYNFVNNDGAADVESDSLLAGAPIAIKDIFSEK